MAVDALLIFNHHGRPRYQQFYSHHLTAKAQRAVEARVHAEVVKAQVESGSPSNIIDQVPRLWASSSGDVSKIVYRSYANLYFCLVLPSHDSTESDLALLDFIQVIVEVLDKCFEAVCELDLVFEYDKVHWVLGEMISGGGLIAETQMDVIIDAVREQKRLMAESKSWR